MSERERERKLGKIGSNLVFKSRKKTHNNIKLTNRTCIIYNAFLPLFRSTSLSLSRSVATLLIKLVRKSCVLVWFIFRLMTYRHTHPFIWNTIYREKLVYCSLVCAVFMQFECLLRVFVISYLDTSTDLG